MSEWCTLVIRANRSPSSPSTIQTSHRGLPRSSRWENTLPTRTMYPLADKGPYYAFILAAGALDTSGGPQINERAQVLRDNLVPYALSGHVHEREVSHQLQYPVRFMPHVAAFFRGISLTMAFELRQAVTADGLEELFRQAYADEAGVRVSREIPQVRAVQNTAEVHIGGFTVDARDPRRGSLVVVLDNLLKGAASQAMQNLNLALGLEERRGIDR